MQLWFLSVLLNVLAGLVLIFSVTDAEGASDTPESFSTAPAFFENKTFRLVLGILCALVGVIKLGVTLTGVPVVGDLLPALAGIAAGGALLVDYYTNSSSLAVDFPAIVQKICFEDKKYLGIAAIIVAVLHFIFPRILFL
jgi:hypothetical protein